MLSNIRNTLHSNGLFNPPSQKNEQIIYQNKIFNFEVGKPIPYGDWTNLFSITKVIVISFYKMTQNAKIKSITHINEPFSDYW